MKKASVQLSLFVQSTLYAINDYVKIYIFTIGGIQSKENRELKAAVMASSLEKSYTKLSWYFCELVYMFSLFFENGINTHIHIHI